MFKNKQGTDKWGPAIVVCMAVLIIVLDMSAMNVAITKLVIDLNTNLTTIQAIISLYALVIASFMLIGSKLQDIIGRKKSFLAGVLIYGVGTILASLSVSSGMLLLGWAILEGIGSALMLPATTTIIGASYSGKDKITAFGIWGGITAMGSAIGPIFGGFFTSYLSWRFIFGSEFLIVLAIILFSYYIPDSKSKLKWKEFDYTGAILSVVSLVIMVLGLLLINNPKMWNIAPIVLGIGLVLLGIFFIWEKHRLNKCLEPLSDIRLLKDKIISIGIVNSIFQQIPLAGFLFIMPVFLQQVAKLDAFTTGLVLLPSSLAIMVFSLLGAKISEHLHPKYILVLGFLTATLGTFLLGGQFSTTMSPWSIIPSSLLFGIGVGLVLSQLTNYVMSEVDENKSSDAAGLLNTFRNLGYSIGTAIIGVLLIVGIFGGLTISIQETGFGSNLTKDEIHSQLFNYFDKMQTNGSRNLPPELQGEASTIINNTTSIAMKMIFHVLSLLFIIGGVISLILPKKKISDDVVPVA